MSDVNGLVTVSNIAKALGRNYTQVYAFLTKTPKGHEGNVPQPTASFDGKRLYQKEDIEKIKTAMSTVPERRPDLFPDVARACTVRFMARKFKIKPLELKKLIEELGIQPVLIADSIPIYPKETIDSIKDKAVERANQLRDEAKAVTAEAKA